MKKIEIHKVNRLGLKNNAPQIHKVNRLGLDSHKKKEKESPIKEKIKLRIGVFFDGTGNNRYNSEKVYYKHVTNSTTYMPSESMPELKHKGEKEEFEVALDSSYWNPYSNIVLLHDLYEEDAFGRDKETDVRTMQIRQYIEGIGTLEDEKDDTRGSAFGEGDRGIVARAKEACEKIIYSLKEIYKINANKHEIIELSFDVFGFSRGAATARHFCNEVLQQNTSRSPLNKSKFDKKEPIPTQSTKDKYFTKPLVTYPKDNLQVNIKEKGYSKTEFTGGYLGKLFTQNGINFPKENVSVTFLGLFDTVISKMIEKENIDDYLEIGIPIISPIPKPIVASVISTTFPDVVINDDNKFIKRGFHIQANDEWRYNFAFTPSTNSNIHKMTVLGAHSNIGGGYMQSDKEKTILEYHDVKVNETLPEDKEKLKDWYIHNLYCKTGEIEWKILYSHAKVTISAYGKEITSYVRVKHDIFQKGNIKTEYKDFISTTYEKIADHYILESTRSLNNKLSLVAMNAMQYIAIKFGNVPFFTKHTDAKPQPPFPWEYEFPDTKKEENKQFGSLKAYNEQIKNVAEEGWQDASNKLITNTKLYENYTEKIYQVANEDYILIRNKYTHLSSNYNQALLNLDHQNLAFTNHPRKTGKINPPYEREIYPHE